MCKCSRRRLHPPPPPPPHRCEMGLDPGMDHMSAVELIERAHALGGVVTSFTSNCGGLPSPEVHASAQHGAPPRPHPTGGVDYPLRPKHANDHNGAPSPPSPHRWRPLPPSATSSRGRPRVSAHHGAPSPPSPSRGCPRVSSLRLATTRARVHASAHHGAAPPLSPQVSSPRLATTRAIVSVDVS